MTAQGCKCLLIDTVRQPIMAEQLAILQQRASTRCGKPYGGSAIYNLQQQYDLEDQILPLKDDQDADAMPQFEPSIKILMHGYRNAVSALPDKDPATQEDLTAFKKCVGFPDETLRRLVKYTFAHCMSRQCLQLHHPDNFLSEILD
ncbi:MAG: hypothetical protein L6R36_006436 [Xanthoria steineri]|nr:MAG: hypothetical protein L6R36_006436 [Xanthoria steineri]